MKTMLKRYLPMLKNDIDDIEIDLYRQLAESIGSKVNHQQGGWIIYTPNPSP
jgi:hypothetical protein